VHLPAAPNGPPAQPGEGTALLQGLAICGPCGRRMTSATTAAAPKSPTTSASAIAWKRRVPLPDRRRSCRRGRHQPAAARSVRVRERYGPARSLTGRVPPRNKVRDTASVVSSTDAVKLVIPAMSIAPPAYPQMAASSSRSWPWPRCSRRRPSPGSAAGRVRLRWYSAAPQACVGTATRGHHQQPTTGALAGRYYLRTLEH